MNTYLRTLLVITLFVGFSTNAMDPDKSQPTDNDPKLSDCDRKKQVHNNNNVYTTWTTHTEPSWKGNKITSCAMSPNGQLLAHGFKKIGIVFASIEEGISTRLSDSGTYDATRVTCSPKEQHIMAGESLHTGAHRLRIYYNLCPFSNREALKNDHYPVSDTIRSLCYTHDGEAIALGLDDGSVHLRNMSALSQTAKQFLLNKNPILDSEPVEALACIDNTTFCCGLNKSLVLFDTRAEGAATRIPGHMSRISRVATASTHPTLLASGAYDGTVKLWDLRKNAAHWTAGWSKVVISALALHSRYEHVIMGDKEGIMRIIINTCDAIEFKKAAYDAPVVDLAITHDGNRITSASSNGIYTIYGEQASIAAMYECWKQSEPVNDNNKSPQRKKRKIQNEQESVEVDGFLS